MGLYDKRQEIRESVLCYTGYVISENIQLYSKPREHITIGKKTFHCLRRFTLDAIPGQCDKCTKDMSANCFYIPKCYYSDRLVEILVEVYKNKAKKLIGANAIWWDNEKYKEIVECLHAPISQYRPVVKQIQKDYFQELEDKKDENIF